MKVLLVVLLVSMASSAQAQSGDGAMVIRSTDVSILTTDGYPLDTCIVSGDLLGKEPELVEAQGRTFKTCCPECAPKIVAEPAAFGAKLDAAVVASQDAHYPKGPKAGMLSRCPVCRKGFPDTGPVDAVAGNTLVKVCSDECAQKAGTVKKLVETAVRGQVALQVPTYKATLCPACGQAPGAEAAWIQHGTTLVKVCNAACVEVFRLQPNACVAKLAEQAQGADSGDAAASK